MDIVSNQNHRNDLASHQLNENIESSPGQTDAQSQSEDSAINTSISSTQTSATLLANVSVGTTQSQRTAATSTTTTARADVGVGVQQVGGPFPRVVVRVIPFIQNAANAQWRNYGPPPPGPDASLVTRFVLAYARLVGPWTRRTIESSLLLFACLSLALLVYVHGAFTGGLSWGPASGVPVARHDCLAGPGLPGLDTLPAHGVLRVELARSAPPDYSLELSYDKVPLSLNSAKLKMNNEIFHYNKLFLLSRKPTSPSWAASTSRTGSRTLAPRLRARAVSCLQRSVRSGPSCGARASI